MESESFLYDSVQHWKIHQIVESRQRSVNQGKLVAQFKPQLFLPARALGKFPKHVREGHARGILEQVSIQIQHMLPMGKSHTTARKNKVSNLSVCFSIGQWRLPSIGLERNNLAEEVFSTRLSAISRQIFLERGLTELP